MPVDKKRLADVGKLFKLVSPCRAQNLANVVQILSMLLACAVCLGRFEIELDNGPAAPRHFSGLGSRVSGLGSRIFGSRVSGSRVSGLGSRVSGVGSSLGSGVSGLGSRASGLGVSDALENNEVALKLAPIAALSSHGYGLPASHNTFGF